MPCVEQFEEFPHTPTRFCGGTGVEENHVSSCSSPLRKRHMHLHAEGEEQDHEERREETSHTFMRADLEEGSGDNMNRPGPRGDGPGDGQPIPPVVLFEPEDLNMQWRKEYHCKIGAGLINMGSTCYLNAVLQCLTHTAPLANYCITGEHPKHCMKRSKNMFCVMCLFIRHVKSTLQPSPSTIRPTWVYLECEENTICKTFKATRQEDAHEFMRFMVEEMKQSCLNGYTNLDQLSKDTTVMNQIFGGYLRSQVKCLKCHGCSNKYEPFMDISLEISNLKNRHKQPVALSVEEAFRHFVKPETLSMDNAYKCQRCCQSVRAQKSLRIHKAPKVLTIQLKRFGYYNGTTKIRKHIRFDSKIDLRPYMCQTTGEMLIYRLYAVLVHVGLHHNSGHYFSYVKSPSNMWYFMNDDEVRPATPKEVFGGEGYILMYISEPPRHRIHRLLSETPSFNAANKGWTTNSKCNVKENHCKGNGVANGPVSGASGRHGTYNGHVSESAGKHGASDSHVNGSADTHSLHGKPFIRRTNKLGAHGSHMNGTAGKQGAYGSSVNGRTGKNKTHSRPVNGTDRNASKDSGGVGASGSRPDTSPYHAPQSASSSSTPATALPQQRTKVSFGINRRAFQPVHSQVPESRQRREASCSTSGKRIVMKYKKNRHVKFVEKSPYGEELLITRTLHDREPSPLVPYDDDDSESGEELPRTTSHLEASEESSDMGKNSTHQQQNGESVFHGSSATSTSNGENKEDSLEEGKEEFDNVRSYESNDHVDDGKTSSSAQTENHFHVPPHAPFTSSTDTNQCTDTGLNCGQDSANLSDFVDKTCFKGNSRDRRARSGSLDKRDKSLIWKPPKRSSSVEPGQRHFKPHLGTADELHSSSSFIKRTPDINVSESVSTCIVKNSDLENNACEFSEFAQNGESQRTAQADDCVREEKLCRKKKKKHKKNRDRYGEHDLTQDVRRRRHKKKRRHHDDSDSEVRSRWHRACDSSEDNRKDGDARHIDADYDHKPSMKKRKKVDSSESEYEWTERTKESLFMENATPEKLAAEKPEKPYQRNGDRTYPDTSSERGQRHFNWNGHHELPEWNVGDRVKRKPEESYWNTNQRYQNYGRNGGPSRERQWWEEYDYQSRYPSQSYSRYPSPSQARFYGDQNPYRSTPYYRDHNHNSFNSNRHYDSYRNYNYPNYQRRY